MATIQNNLIIGGGSDHGFINIPSGTWETKSTVRGDSFPGFSSNVIPIAMNQTASSNHGWSENTQIGFSGSTTCAVNGKTSGKATASKGANVGSTNWSTRVDVYNVYLPAFYNMDLTAVQNGVKSGTITVWLQKK